MIIPSVSLVLKKVGVTLARIFKLMQILMLPKFFWSFVLQKVSIWIPDVDVNNLEFMAGFFLNVVNAF